MRVVILQNGDYGEAYRRLQNGGPETYRDQRRSVNFIASLAANHEVTTVAGCDRNHDEVLEPGLRSIGVSAGAIYSNSNDGLWPLFDELNADAFICRTPSRAGLMWAARHQVPTLPTFADIIGNGGVRGRLNNWRLGRVLNQCVTPCVANHSLTASKSLTRLGVSPERIVPWELNRIRPFAEPKTAPRRDRPFRLFYAGMLTESKGVGDCIEAVAIANAAAHTKVELNIAGPGDSEHWRSYARARGVESSVRIMGIIAADQVLAEMRDNDAVVVPSRHDYSEGLPNTIFEALASRSPLIASDHPSFVNRLRPAVDSLRFHAGHARGLAEQVERLMHGGELYSRLSRHSASALSGLYVGLEWTELVSRFMEDPLCKSDWIQGYTLADIMARDAEKSTSRSAGSAVWPPTRQHSKTGRSSAHFDQRPHNGGCGGLIIPKVRRNRLILFR